MEVITVQNGYDGTTAILDLDFCRLCLGRDKTGLISVFSEEVNVAGDVPLAAKILRFFEVQICEEDILPRQICQQCLLQTESCAEFRELCIQNDQKLREIVFLPEPVVEEPQGEGQEQGQLLVCEEPEGDEEEEEEEEREEVVIDPANNYESSNQSAPEPFSYGDDTTPAGESDLNDGGLVLDTNTNDSSEDLLELMDDSKLKKLVHMCKYCDVAFAALNACYLHESQDHDILAPYACQFCEFKTANRNMLITHIRDVHGIDRPYICIQCNKGFHRRSDLKKHTFVHSGVRPFACDQCGKSFSRNTNLTKHMRIHSGFKPHICNTCPRSFANKADLVRHQNIHMSLGKQFSCSKCHNTYARKDKLLSHERICFAKQQQQQQQQLQQQQLTQLMATAAATIPTMAHYDSGENMVISLDPYQEIDSAVPAEDDPGIPNAGPISAVSSFSNVSLGQIVSTGTTTTATPQPTPPKLFSCQKCPKKFLSKNTLAYNTHQLTHSDVRNYRCHTCDKKFIRKRELDRHLTAVHSNHKPFECGKCAKRFSRKDKLLRHERVVHREDKLFACGACDAKFLRKEALAVHAKVHCTAVADVGDPVIIVMQQQDHEGLEGEDGEDDEDEEVRHELLQQVLSYEVGGMEAAAAML